MEWICDQKIFYVCFAMIMSINIYLLLYMYNIKEYNMIFFGLLYTMILGLMFQQEFTVKTRIYKENRVNKDFNPWIDRFVIITMIYFLLIRYTTQKKQVFYLEIFVMLMFIIYYYVYYEVHTKILKEKHKIVILPEEEPIYTEV